MTKVSTFYAFATGGGTLAVLRLSGPDVRAVLEHFGISPLPLARRASLRKLKVPAALTSASSTGLTPGELIDEALVLWFPGPESYTGEDLAEIHLHGSLAVREALLCVLASLKCCRIAAPGEFTRRAVLNGRMGLSEAEAVADLIASETAGQRRQALRQLSGALGNQFSNWQKKLTEVLAYTEANIDFVEEDDLPDDLADSHMVELTTLRQDMLELLETAQAGERMRSGLHVTIVGPPNAGKSTLLNALARRDVAIVSPEAGTTRDILEVRLDLNGLPVVLSDTAGLRTTSNCVEAEGVRRAHARAKNSDVTLVLCPANEAVTADTLEILQSSYAHEGNVVIPIISKADLPCTHKSELERLKPIWMSLTSSEYKGLDEVITALEKAARAQTGDGGMLTRARHTEALKEVVVELNFALGVQALELRAEHLRSALAALGRVTGDLGCARIGVEDLLDIVFRDFCIGK